jgi:hypothetical protein
MLGCRSSNAKDLPKSCESIRLIEAASFVIRRASSLPRKGLYFSGGVWSDHSTELRYDPGGDLYVTEEGWGSSGHGLPYKLQVGAWRDTGKFQRFQGAL